MRRPLLIAGVLSAGFASAACGPMPFARAEKPRAADAVVSLLDAIFAPRRHVHGPSCGCALPALPPSEPTCGAEPECGVEPGCGLEALAPNDFLHHDAFAPAPRLHHAPVRLRLQSHPPAMIDRSFAPAPRLPHAPALPPTDESSSASSAMPESSEPPKAMPLRPKGLSPAPKAMRMTSDDAHPPAPIVEPMPEPPMPEATEAMPTVEAIPMPAAPMPKPPAPRPKPVKPVAPPMPVVETVEETPAPMPNPRPEPAPEPAPEPQPVPMPEPEPMPEPMPEAMSAPMPEPTPIPAPASEIPPPTAEPLPVPAARRPAPEKAAAPKPAPRPLAPAPKPLPNYDHTDPFADPAPIPAASSRPSATPALTPLPNAVEPPIDPETIEIPRFGDGDFSPVGTGVRPTSGVELRGPVVRPAIRIVPIDTPAAR